MAKSCVRLPGFGRDLLCDNVLSGPNLWNHGTSLRKNEQTFRSKPTADSGIVMGF